VAGNGTDRYLGDGAPAATAQLDHPVGTAVDAAGNVFIVERNRTRRVSAAVIITTVQGGGRMRRYHR
jgi:hypothetical protein